MNEHKITYGPVHDMDCPPCVAKAAAQDKWAQENNPHRPGTKIAAEWYSNNRGGRPWLDPRYETYWSM